MNKGLFTKTDADAIKGICAVLVLVCHLHQLLERSQVENYFFNSFGYLSVALFFFISGFGLYKSYQKKGEEYIKGLLLNRILPIWLINVFLIILYTVVRLYLDKDINTKDIVLSFIWGGDTVKYGWYMQVSVILYLFFYVSFSIKGSIWKKYAVLSTLMVLYYVAAWIKVGSGGFQWYATSPCFFIGAFWSNVYDRINDKVRSDMKMLLCLFTAFLSILILSINNYLPASIIWKYAVAPTLLCLFVFFLTGRVNLYNRLTVFLAGISLEVYTLQGLAFILTENVPTFHGITTTSRIISIAFLTFLLSLLTKPIYEMILCLPKRMSKKK